MKKIAIAASLFLSAVLFATSLPTQSKTDLPRLTRDSIMATAKLLAEHQWVMVHPENEVAECANSGYSTGEWSVGDSLKGIAYDWGGADGPILFDEKIRNGQGAGSRKFDWPENDEGHPIAKNCTAGMDCSGFVLYTWGYRDPRRRHHINTTVMANRRSFTDLLESDETFDYKKDLREGDAYVKKDVHVYLFYRYESNGKPVFFEADPHKRRVQETTLDWGDLNGYVPIRYKGVIERE